MDCMPAGYRTSPRVNLGGRGGGGGDATAAAEKAEVSAMLM